MMILPYKMETIFTRLPAANIVIIVFTSLVTYFVWWGYIPAPAAEAMVLQDWDIGQMVGNTLLHGGFLHLLGNMLFLWIFGNAICSAVGNTAYPFIYVFLGIMASAVHLLFDGRPAIGASGAINGVVGMAFVLFPVNNMKIIFNIFFFVVRRFTIKAFWMIAFWFVFDILGSIQGGGAVAYWAHIGGFAWGMIIATILIYFEKVETYDPTLIDIVTGRKMERTRHTLTDLQEMKRMQDMTSPTDLYGFGEPAPVLQDPFAAAPVSPNPVTPQAAVKENPVLILRLLNTARKGSTLLCYFVNDGDPVQDVVVEQSEPCPAVFHPSGPLGKRSPGWLQIENADGVAHQSLKMTLSFDIGTGMRMTKTLVFRTDPNRFAEV